MQTLILPFSETDTDILAFINRLRRQKKAFEIKNSEPDATVDWSGKWSTYEMAMPVLARDWENEDCWDELYEQIKPVAS